MAKKLTHSYTAEQFSGWDRSKLETLRANAARHDAADLVALCTEELAKEEMFACVKRKSRLNVPSRTMWRSIILSVQRDAVSLKRKTGAFWSGSWVVAEGHVKESIQYGAVLALHESKSETSYRQGDILDYRVAARDMVDKTNVGIEFLVQERSQSLVWIGAGAGEKGYRWEKLKSRNGNKKASTEEPQE